MILKQYHKDGAITRYTLVSLQPVEGEDAAIVTTQEAGAIVVSRADTPDMWSQLVKAELV